MCASTYNHIHTYLHTTRGDKERGRGEKSRMHEKAEKKSGKWIKQFNLDLVSFYLVIVRRGMGAMGVMAIVIVH